MEESEEAGSATRRASVKTDLHQHAAAGQEATQETEETTMEMAKAKRRKKRKRKKGAPRRLVGPKKKHLTRSR